MDAPNSSSGDLAERKPAAPAKSKTGERAGFRPPEIPQAQVEAANREISERKFSPSTNRLPDEVLPEPDFIRILDQGQEGVSVGVGVAAMLNYLRAKEGQREPVSPRMLYEYAKVYDEWPGTDYEGSSLLGAMTGLWRHGVCLDREWPLYGAGAPAVTPEVLERAKSNRPAAILRVEPNIANIRGAVFEHGVVVVSGLVHSGWDKPVKGVIPFENRKRERNREQITGGHAFAIVGYTREGFIVQNSWGTSWGGPFINGRELKGAAIWKFDDARQNLQDAWVAQLARAAYRAPLVGYDADTLGGSDLLDIKGEVSAFSYVIASRAIKPPLALGLFGDWGGGKSFFMDEMQRKIASLTAFEAGQSKNPDRAPVFCKKVVQITFNAWHYLDTDLWASLVTEIFDKLFQSIGGPNGTPEEKLPALTKELETANGVYQQAKQQLGEAEAARSAAEGALKTAVEQRQKIEDSLADKLNDLGKLLKDDPAVRGELKKLSADLGVPELEKSFTELEARAKEVKELKGRVAVLGSSILSGRWGWVRLFWLGAALLAPVLILGALEFLRRRFGVEIQTFHSAAAQISTLATALAAWLGAQVKHAGALVQKISDTHQRLENIRNARREAETKAEEQSLRVAKEKENAARKSVQDAEQRVQALQREIAELQPGRLIMRFIEERTKSTDYRSRLGIVSLVRRDFERLSQLADRSPAGQGGNETLMPVERIVLYIDDLDRCKPERVIDVLEAVHLLLAFPLFMVVVAVDPRWLRRCLEKNYPDLLTIRTQSAPAFRQVGPSRPATAQDYLEKIFQIPFTLQPMQADGYRRMVRGLTERNLVKEAAAARVGDPTPAAAQPAPAGSPGAPAGNSGTPAGASAAAPSGTAAPSGPPPALPPAPTVSDETAVEQLRMRAWELKDIERLAPLFHTPRAVKRFVNTYRFLRAGVRPHEISLFEGTEDDPGTYRAPLTLLAVVVGYGNVAPRFLRRVMDYSSGNAKNWLEFLNEAKKEARSKIAGSSRKTSARGNGKDAAMSEQPEHSSFSWEDAEWIQLCDALIQVSVDTFPVHNISELRDWTRTVARYSFSLTSTANLES